MVVILGKRIGGDKRVKNQYALKLAYLSYPEFRNSHHDELHFHY